MEQSGPGTPAQSSQEALITSWQHKLLPLMIGMLVAMTVFAIAANLYQVRYVEQHIETSDHFDPKLIQEMLQADKEATPADKFAYARWMTVASLEGAAMESRYHQASVMFLSRVYIIFLGFATGMVLALVGASFILGKLREQASSLSAEHPTAWKIAFTSSSPGLILAFLGTLLMIFTIVTRAEVNVQDQSLYIPALFSMPDTKADTSSVSPKGSPNQSVAPKQSPSIGRSEQLRKLKNAEGETGAQK